MQNDGEDCFEDAVLAGLYPVEENPQRASHYREHKGKLDFKGIEMPMKLKSITKFEGKNDVSVSVYGVEENRDGNGETKGYIYPLKVVREMKSQHVDLLLISAGDRKHYCTIKSLSRLVGGQVTSSTREQAYFDFVFMVL